jgi:hypothetical protein
VAGERGEILTKRRKLCNEELHNPHSPPNVIKVINSKRLRWVGTIAYMNEMINTYQVMVGKPEGMAYMNG